MDARRTKPKPKVLPLDKKIKANQKYQNVPPVTDTGNTIKKQREKIQELRHFYRFRPDEIFRRVTVPSMIRLLIEVSKLEYQVEDSAIHSNSSLVDLEQTIEEQLSGNQKDQLEVPSSYVECDSLLLVGDKENRDESVLDPQIHGEVFESVVCKGKVIHRTSKAHNHLHSSVGDLIAGVSHLNVLGPSHEQANSLKPLHSLNSKNFGSHLTSSDGKKPCESQEAEGVVEEHLIPIVDRPFLLLDVRLKEDFERAHLIFSRSYPANRLSRAVNFETKEMLQYKNKQGKLIIIYDYDESIAHTFASALVQRGYTNVFMISGGIRIVQMKFPSCLIRKGGSELSHQEERLCEEDIHTLETFLEASASGGGKISSSSSLVQHRVPSGLSHSMHLSIRSHVKNPIVGRPWR